MTQRPDGSSRPGRVRGLAVLVVAIGILSTIFGPASAQVLLVSPARDHNDRIDAILDRTTPTIRVERVRLIGGPKKPELWRRSIGERDPVDLRRARLVILENAPASGLSDVPVVGGGNLLDALPAFTEAGGHLLVVGGWPSFETYPETSLARILPAKIAADPNAMAYQDSKRLALTGNGSRNLTVRHLHPVDSVRGEVLVRAAGKPFAVRSPAGRGEVVLVLGGIQEHYRPDAGDPDSAYFASTTWDEFVIGRVTNALGRKFEAGERDDPSALASPTIRIGQSFRPTDWFKKATRGTLTLVGPLGQEVMTIQLPQERSRLPEELRPGRYEAVHEGRGPTNRRVIRVGTAADLNGFDIRLFALAHSPGPIGLAPGEAYRRSRQLADIGFTSAVYAAYRRRPISNLRTLQEILYGGLQIVYYQSIRSKSRYPSRWPQGSTAPHVATDLEGKRIGWDVHSPAFRDEVGNLFDGQEAILALPGLRAVQLIEENKDGNRRSPSLRPRIAALGLSGNERPGDPGWLALEDLRSEATRVTYQAYRSLGHRLFPGLPLSTYWPGSYWSRRTAYTHRVSALASAIDEFLGPGYGYNGKSTVSGWLSVIRTTNEIFNAHDFAIDGSKGMAVYAQGRPIAAKGGRHLGMNSWTETAWTALAHGATSVAYFDLPHGAAIQPLADLHRELHRIGPWLAKSPRRPGGVAILASWSTRTGGTKKESVRHHNCIVQTHDALVYGIEGVDFVREEQLDRLPESIQGIVLSAAPLLTDDTIKLLHDFVRQGRHLFVDGESGGRKPDGSTRSEPWSALRATGRVHEIQIAERCNALGRLQTSRKVLGARWRDRLARIGVSPISATLDPKTEARMSGDGDIRYWVFLNHHPEPRRLKARAELAADDWLWRDLRADTQVQPVAVSGALVAEPQVDGHDAAVWVGSRRPSAALQIVTSEQPHQIIVEVRALDEAGQPVPDTSPLALSVRDAKGKEMLASDLRSRSTLGGNARWQIPIPADDPGGEWSIQAEAPLAGIRSSVSIGLTAPFEGP